MTSIEQRILDIIQDGFPVAERPYADLADLLNRAPTCHPERSTKCEVDIELSATCCPTILRFVGAESSITEQSVFDAVEELRTSGVIRRLGGVYDSRKLGFISRLCAGVVPVSELDFSEPREGRAPTALESFAAAVAEIPSITHNYVRSHHYNVWFTVIAESEEAVQAVVRKLETTTALHDVHVLASERMFKINTVMRGGGERRETKDERNDGDILSKRSASKDFCASSNIEARRATSYLTPDTDKLRIQLLSGDIPHTLTPFADLCGLCGCSLEDFLDRIREDLASRRMRRFGAVLRHQAAGFAYNAMVCFCIDERRETGNVVAEAGAVLAANPHVSHCYERAPFEGFPYNVYAMFHASSSSELDQVVSDAAQSVANLLPARHVEYAVLHSVRELKKTSFKFFSV